MKRAEPAGRRSGTTRLASLSTLYSCLLALLLTGCGAPAAPQPPTLNLPLPVSSLAAARSGDIVRLSFAVPQKTTDKLPVRGEVMARLCRSLDAGPCEAAGTMRVKPAESPAIAMEDRLPVALTTAPQRLLAYSVTLEDSAGKSAGASNAAYAVGGEAPAPVSGFTARPRRDGIVLTWQPSHLKAELNADLTQTDAVRFDRVLTAGAPAATVRGPGEMPAEPEEPADQSLLIPELTLPPAPATASAPSMAALDATARTGRSYRYTAVRVAHSTLSGHQLEVSSAPSAAVLVTYRDVFPPPPPTGLVSAVDTPGRSIDLSWSPGQDTHLSGYVIYRRPVNEAAAPASPLRVSPAGKPVTTTNWSDTTAVTGQRYAYSVSAVDPAGNESARSAEVEETLPAPDAKP